MGKFYFLNHSSCTNLCLIEEGYFCINGGPDGSICFNRCGDGKDADGTHSCDDGNLHPDDGCDEECELEAGFDCTPITFPTDCVEECDGTWWRFLVCDDGGSPGCTSCDATDDTYDCSLPSLCGAGDACGNTYDAASRNCEDLSARHDDRYWFDGCDWQCNYEAGFTCVKDGSSIDTCTEDCGDGFDMWYYECDDGNTAAGDGCDGNCEIEYGYECFDGNPNQADTCQEICGDGIDLYNYWCDDGNYESGDGCDVYCRIERGWSCTGGDSVTPDTCTEICGDGIDLQYYECDDGNLEDDDGCSSTCEIETGW